MQLRSEQLRLRLRKFVHARRIDHGMNAAVNRAHGLEPALRVAVSEPRALRVLQVRLPFLAGFRRQRTVDLVQLRIGCLEVLVGALVERRLIGSVLAIELLRISGAARYRQRQDDPHQIPADSHASPPEEVKIAAGYDRIRRHGRGSAFGKRRSQPVPFKAGFLRDKQITPDIRANVVRVHMAYRR